MDILSLKRELASKLPPVYCTCEKPLFAGDYIVHLNYWDETDYKSTLTELVYYDGKEFHLYDMTKQDNSNWIENWIYFPATFMCEINEKYISEVNRGWRVPDPKYCKFNSETKKYELLKE